MRQIYSLILASLMPLIILRLLWRSLRLSAYRRRLGERFARFTIPNDKQQGIWVHAVSVGETILAIPLIQQLQKQHPNLSIIVTTTTPTGSALVTEKLVPQGIFHVYAPYDLPSCVRRFLDKVKPCMAIMIETELWPNIFHACHQRNIKLVVANARLSARSAARYQRLKSLTCAMLQTVDCVIAQTQADGDRFVALGLPTRHLQITGSIKFDMPIPDNITPKIAQMRQLLGAERPVFIAASTHDGEEEHILKAFAAIRQQRPELLLVLVPRHPDRFNKVAELCQQHGFTIVRRSQQQACDQHTNIFIGDSMGELLVYYGASDIAFVGGSLAPTGGHNMLEPAAFAKPILCGPHLFNFQQISDMMIAANAMLKITNSEELTKRCLVLLADDNACERMGQAGKAVIAANRGALQKHVDIINGLLPASGG